MSRIGKKPIPLPSGVTFTHKGNIVDVKGPKGALQVEILDGIEIDEKDNQILVINSHPGVKLYTARHGLIRSLLANAVTGVSEGFVKVLELYGVGYKVDLKKSGLDFALGFSHPIFMEFPEGITAEVDKTNNIISVMGVDKQKVGQYCADVRKLRPPEPYKGKGFRYKGERVRRKSGKTV
ncbi:50S ribosomal protein L6 [bacterium]|nr:50S ribosomal protein L6 [bacterium]